MLSYSPNEIFISVDRYSISIYPKYEDEKKLSSMKKKYKDNEIISNDPLSGFRLEHSYSGWSLLDPRGFTYSIKDSDISYIIDNCVVDNGEIISKCRYYWNGRRMSIISEFDPRFEKINQSKEQREFSISELEVGDSFSLHGDNKRYIYYGERYIVSNRLSRNLFLTKNSIYNLYDINNSSYYYEISPDYGATLTKLAISEDGKKVESFTNKKVYDLEKTKFDVSVFNSKIEYNNTSGYKLIKVEHNASNNEEFDKIIYKINSVSPSASSYYNSTIYNQYFLMKIDNIHYVIKTHKTRSGLSYGIRKISDKIEGKINSTLSRIEKSKNKKLNISTIMNIIIKEFNTSTENIDGFTYDVRSRKPNIAKIKDKAIFYDFAVTEI